MVDIHIDTRCLTGTKFQVVGSHLGWFEGADTPAITLEPGDYGFQQFGTPASFRFTVTRDGLIDYDDAYEAFLAGRGTSTLVVKGYPLTLDGTALSHDLKPTLEGVADLSRFHVHELVLAPATAYSVLSAGGIKANFDFNVELDGQVTFNEAYARFAMFQEGTLTIHGYPITIDGRALSQDLLPLLLGVSSPLARDHTHELTLIPGAGYSFQTGAAPLAFQFELKPDGQLTVDPRFAAFAEVSGRTLTVKDEGSAGWSQVAEALAAQNETLRAINAGTDYLAQIDQRIGALRQPPTLALNMRGGAVADLHEQLRQIGVLLPSEEVAGSIFGIGTQSALLQFQTKYNVAQTGSFDEATRKALAIAISNAAHLRRVEGRIFTETGLPAANIKLRIVNRGFGDDAPLLGEGEIETDERGFYALSYMGATANIEIHALAADGTTVKLSTPKVNADRAAVINLVAPAAVQSQANEWQLLARDLTTVIGEDMGRLAQARESVNGQDISLLHETTQWDARLIASAAIAAKTTATTGIEQEALYGALRAGLPADSEALAAVSREAFAGALAQANTAGIIALNENRMTAALSAFDTFRLETRGKTIVPGALCSMGEMLAMATIDTEQLDKFKQLALLHDGDDAQLWQDAKAAGIPPEQISTLQLQGKLAYLTLNNAPLTATLQAEIGTQDQLAQLIEKDLYRQEAWVTRLNKMSKDDPDSPTELTEHELVRLAQLIPPAYTQPTIVDRRDTYAADMARMVRQSFPTQVVQRMIGKDELKLGADHDALKRPVQTFLQQAVGQGFQIGRTPVEQFIQQNRDSLFAGVVESEQALAETGVKLLTRAYQMTPSDNAMTALLDLGFTSARQVTALDRITFVERYREHFGSRQEAEAVWDKSKQITSVTYNLQTLGKKLDSEPPLWAISGSPQAHTAEKTALKGLLKAYPTMESLFGSQDFCECEHCRSVLSPAAYLVDLLRFVDPSPEDWQHTLKYWKKHHHDTAYGDPPYNFLKPYDALIARRPDIPHLPLTCENTNVALPYIDLVNEILEYYVHNKKLDEQAVHDTGEVTSAELLAEPHNLIPEAYDTLKAAKFPLTLPFDLWLETVRRFCAYFEKPLWQVLDVFRPNESLFPPDGAYARAAIFAEYLGIPKVEYDLYTSETDLANLYGYPGEDTPTIITHLQSAKTLSRRLGVSYQEIADLIQTDFVNPNLSTLIMLHKLGVAVSDVIRYQESLTAAQLTDEQQLEKAEFEQRLTQATAKYKPQRPAFNAAQRLEEAWNEGHFKQVLLLRDTGGCNFDETTLLYSDGSTVTAYDLLKLNLFVRLWKRLGWTLEETDRALHSFLPSNPVLDATTIGKAMQTALVYLAHLKELTELLNVGKNGRIKLLTLWGDLPTRGKNSLYAQLFLIRNVLKDDAVFDDPLGDYLSKPDLFINAHLPALQAALTLTADEIRQILQDGNTGAEALIDSATLTLANVSLLYRYGLLAKGLKLSVAELITLKTLSGLNPFTPLHPTVLSTIAEDYPLVQTIAFVRLAQQIKMSGFAIPDLDYLLRHQVDPLEKAAPVALDWIGNLATQLQGLASEFATPTTITDEQLRQKLALAFAPDVVERFMGFWLNTTVYSAVQEPVPANQRLQPILYAQNGVDVSYDEAKERQQITVIGVLTVSRKDELLAQIPDTADPDAAAARNHFSALLDQIVEQSAIQGKEFFDTYFDGLLNFADYFGAAVVTDSAENRRALLEIMLPYLHAKLSRQAILQAVTAQNGGDAALLETLLDKLGVASFTPLSTNGLTAVLTPTQPEPHTLSDIACDQCTQAEWQGLLAVPQSGVYRVYAQFGKQGARVALQIGDLPRLSMTATQDNQESISTMVLTAGVWYPCTVTADNLQNGTFALLVKGETTAKGQFSQLEALPQAAVNAAIQAYTRVSKAVQIFAHIGLNARDADALSDLDWQQLPTAPTDDAGQQLDGIVQLLNYAALKRAIAGGGDDLIALFEQTATMTVEELTAKIATMTQRDPQSVGAVATELRMTDPTHFADLKRLDRLWQALQIVERFGVQMASLKPWLTPTPDATVATAVRNTIKARYTPESWQRIAQAIFDPLRQRQRDALVAYVMQINSELTSLEKLFEYFLIDPGMEPVVQTSRLRLAISSLQTFIQRCFLNLEPRVHPSMLNASHWRWMKHYRVWEANRKIFLFPENWLEPEWRDDKTHLFQELESTLLQGDVTNQLAEDALYVYLKKLDQLARLEIVTMYAEEQPFAPPILHVIGRTYTLPHQYFYRRYAHQMWTAWEPIGAEIDGHHIVAVMWRERLHLFWLNLTEKVEQSSSGLNKAEDAKLLDLDMPFGDPVNLKGLELTDNFDAPARPPSNEKKEMLTEMSFDRLVSSAGSAASAATRRILDIQLNWSEYFQGSWTTRESSGFGHTIDITGRSFSANKLFITVSVEPDSDGLGAVNIHLHSESFSLQRAFRVVSKNNRPLFQSSSSAAPSSPYSAKNKEYNRFTSASALSVSFVQQIVTTDGDKKVSAPAPQTILNKGGYGAYTLLPTSNQMEYPNAEFAPLVTPLFFADDLYTFFVEPSLTETTVDLWQGYTIPRPSQRPKWDEYILKPPPVSVQIPPKYSQEALKLTIDLAQPESIDAGAIHSFKPNQDAMTQLDRAVLFDGNLIGATGAIKAAAAFNRQ
jgi:hypothetical protein